MKSLLSSKKFIESDMELPITLGKTISNETFIVDLTKIASFANGRCYWAG